MITQILKRIAATAVKMAGIKTQNQLHKRTPINFRINSVDWIPLRKIKKYFIASLVLYL